MLMSLSDSWWRHQMETFPALLAICAGNSPVTGEFPTQRPETGSFHVFFDLRLNKRLSKQWWGWSFETPSCPLWRHCNVLCAIRTIWEDYILRAYSVYTNHWVVWKFTLIQETGTLSIFSRNRAIEYNSHYPICMNRTTMASSQLQHDMQWAFITTGCWKGQVWSQGLLSVRLGITINTRLKMCCRQWYQTDAIVALPKPL